MRNHAEFIFSLYLVAPLLLPLSSSSPPFSKVNDTDSLSCLRESLYWLPVSSVTCSLDFNLY